MKKVIAILILSVVGIALGTGTSYAYNFTIDDLYVGGNDHGYGDVIGASSKFNIFGMDVTIDDANLMTVDIRTNYVNNIGAMGTDLGDLFISVNGWNPYGDASNGYKYDNAGNGETWEYAFDVSTGRLFNIQSAQDHILTSDVAYNRYTYRNGQEVLVNPDGLTAITNGSVGIDSDSLSMTFDITNMIADFDTFTLGFHWAMTCGNDTIEGVIDPITPAPVPEPGTLFLFGMGLLGILGMIKKRVR